MYAIFVLPYETTHYSNVKRGVSCYFRRKIRDYNLTCWKCCYNRIERGWDYGADGVKFVASRHPTRLTFGINNLCFAHARHSLRSSRGSNSIRAQLAYTSGACVTVRGAEWTAVSWIIFAVRRMAIAPCRNFGQLRSYIKRSDRVYTYSYVSIAFMTLRTLRPL